MRRGALPAAAEDRPREKLWARGAESLGTNELVAVVLGTGTREASALELADRVLDAAGGLRGLARWTPAHLASVRGVKLARAARLLAAIELGRRLLSEPEGARPVFRSPEDAGRFLLPRLSGKPVEEFGLLALDTRNRLARLEIVSKGSLNGSLVHPREVYRQSVALQAAAIIVFHNHPSGDPTPSREDRDLTRRLAEAGRIVGIELLDHVVVGADRWYSFKQRGLL